MKEEYLEDKTQVLTALHELRRPVRTDAPTLLDVLSQPEAFGLDSNFLRTSLVPLRKQLQEYYKDENVQVRAPTYANIYLSDRLQYNTAMRWGTFSLLDGLISPKVLTLDFLRTYAHLYNQDNAYTLFRFNSDHLHVLQQAEGLFTDAKDGPNALLKKLPTFASAYHDMRICSYLTPLAKEVAPQTPLDALLVGELIDHRSIYEWESPRFQDYAIYEKVVIRNKHRPLIQDELPKHPKMAKGLDFAHIHGDLNRLIAAYGTKDFLNRFVKPVYRQNFLAYYKSIEEHRRPLAA